MSFTIGQRWLSHADSELGLGLVVECDVRRVTLHFPAVAEDRTYAVANAPLTRLRLRAGDRLATRDGESHTVAAVHEEAALLYYETLDGGRRIAELDLDDRIDLSTPTQRLLASQFDSHAAFALRVATCEHRDRLDGSGLRGLLGTRTALLPHQLYIASEVGRRHAPRVLLADEVGLGKTIEAGMILHRQILTGAARRVLVLVPDSLQFQWLVEMRRRFNLPFAIFDAERLAAGDGDNPFEAEQLALCPNGLFEDPAARAAALAAPWDIVVVDEAHRLSRDARAGVAGAGADEPLPALLEALARHSRGLLLLTATPEQVGQGAHFARLALLDPERFHDFERFCEEEQRYRRWSEILEAIDRGESPADMPADIDRSLPTPEQARALIDRYGTGRVLFRNSRAAIGGFPRRELHRHTLPAPGDRRYLGLYPDRDVAHEQWLQEDPRVAWLVAQLRALRPAKVLVICASADTARVLEGHLQLRAGIRAAAFHEGLSLVDRDRAAAYFAETEQGAQALICSEIGGEGRNFQFAQHLVLFDLPRHPDQLEQRIGRLDRIGQQDRIHLHVPHIAGSAQETLLRWYDEGMSLFTQSCSAGDMILARFGARLARQLEQRDADFDILLTDTAEFTAQTRRELSEGRDRLLERSSCDPAEGQALVRAIEEIEDPQLLSSYIEALCSATGVEHDDHSDNTFVLRPGEQEAFTLFTELPEEGCTITTERRRALEREDFVFLGWEHPWLDGAMESLLASPLGQACVGSLSLRGVPAGSRLYEFLFIVRVSAPRALGLGRYLSLAPQRLLVDGGGRDLSAILSHAALNARVESVPRATASKIVRQLRDEIETRVEHAEALVEETVAVRRNAAIDAWTRSQGQELDRMVALRRVNPAIREDEIVALQHRLAEGREALASARSSLQGVRLVVTR